MLLKSPKALYSSFCAQIRIHDDITANLPKLAGDVPRPPTKALMERKSRAQAKTKDDIFSFASQTSPPPRPDGNVCLILTPPTLSCRAVLVTCGSVIKLRHDETRFHLHSHVIKWGGGSGQQSVTAHGGEDDQGSMWIVSRASRVPGVAAVLFVCVCVCVYALAAGVSAVCHAWVCVGVCVFFHQHRPLRACARACACVSVCEFVTARACLHIENGICCDRRRRRVSKVRASTSFVDVSSFFFFVLGSPLFFRGMQETAVVRDGDRLPMMRDMTVMRCLLFRDEMQGEGGRWSPAVRGGAADALRVHHPPGARQHRKEPALSQLQVPAHTRPGGVLPVCMFLLFV